MLDMLLLEMWPTAVYIFVLEYLGIVSSAKIWKTLYMDQEDDCFSTLHNDNMAESDFYVVKSDSWRGGSPWASRPSECSVTFNFDNRIVGASHLQWWCKESVDEPFLAFYDDCSGAKSNLMEWFNCSSAPSFTSLESSSSCISLYHYRGRAKAGYYFRIKVTANKEVLSFPAGGYAAIVVISITIVLVVVKVTCSLYSWIRRSHELDFRLVGSPVSLVEKELPIEKSAPKQGERREESTCIATEEHSSV